MKSEFVIGSRKSQLALIQTQQIKQLLELKFPDIKFSILSMTTTGDEIQTIPLKEIGVKALFTKELEGALNECTVDFVVHSLKDLPTSLPDNLTLASITARLDPRDVVLMSKSNLQSNCKIIEDLRAGSIVGTSSVRRIAQLKKLYPNLLFRDVRGNLNTRLKKLDDGGYDCLILAYAGVHRMGWDDRISQILDHDVMMHAVGQGALGLECRADDVDTLELLGHLEDLESTLRCIAERTFMRVLEGGCSVPLGVHTVIKEIDLGINFYEGSGNEHGYELTLIGSVTSLDGSEQLRFEKVKSIKGKRSHLIIEAEELGQSVAMGLKYQGGDRILQSSR